MVITILDGNIYVLIVMFDIGSLSINDRKDQCLGMQNYIFFSNTHFSSQEKVYFCPLFFKSKKVNIVI